MFKKVFVFFCISFLSLLSASPFVAPNDPVLDKVAEDVSVEEIKSDEIQAIIDRMLAISKIEREDGKVYRMLGLAAPQIGISKNIILADTAFDEVDKDPNRDLEVFINPRITYLSEEMESAREGCYSAGCVQGIVPRHKEVAVEGYDRNGNSKGIHCEGYVARILQHEVDHCQGLRFPDRIEDFDDLHWVEQDEFETYKKEFKNWPKKVSQDKWKEFTKPKN